MNLGNVLIFFGVIACVLLIWFVCRRLRNRTSGRSADPADDAVDGESLLLAGLLLGETADTDTYHAESDNLDAGGYDTGFDSDGGFE